MTRSVWLLIFSFALYGCSSDSEDSSSMAGQEDDWPEDEYEEETVETGSLSISLPGEHGSGQATCDLNLMRVVDKRLANVILTLDVIGKGCDGMGNCSNPDMRGGQMNYSGGIDGDKPFATMVLNYDPPSDSEEGVFWMYNVFLNASPFSRFEMWVDGEPFNALTSDTRGADDLFKGPHFWNAKIDIEADMLQTTDDDDQSPGPQMRGTFSYEGPCEIYVKYMQP